VAFYLIPAMLSYRIPETMKLKRRARVSS